MSLGSSYNVGAENCKRQPKVESTECDIVWDMVHVQTERVIDFWMISNLVKSFPEHREKLGNKN